MKKVGLFFLFLIINFSSLGVGSWLMNNGPMTDWYLQLNKAPWTPPGWVFGAAWTTIMICFSIYMTFLFTRDNSTKVKTLFVIQIILNISWNYVFFNQHLVSLALVNIILLTALILYFLIGFKSQLKLKNLLVLPYAIWLCIATSLNYYVYAFN